MEVWLRHWLFFLGTCVPTQHPHVSTKLSVIPVSEDQTPFSGLWRFKVSTWSNKIHAEKKIPIHIKYFIFLKKKDQFFSQGT